MRIGLPIAASLMAASLLRAGGLWLDVPFVRQSPEGCGAAALAMVMQYWQAHGARVAAGEASEASIAAELFSPAAHGIPAASMARYLDDHGFRAVVFRGEWSDLAEHVAKGRPLIVLLDGGAGLLHYVVVAGVAETGIEINDPADRKLRKVARAEFEKRWRASGSWTLLAVPRPPS